MSYSRMESRLILPSQSNQEHRIGRGWNIFLLQSGWCLHLLALASLQAWPAIQLTWLNQIRGWQKARITGSNISCQQCCLWPDLGGLVYEVQWLIRPRMEEFSWSPLSNSISVNTIKFLIGKLLLTSILTRSPFKNEMHYLLWSENHTHLIKRVIVSNLNLHKPSTFISLHKMRKSITDILSNYAAFSWSIVKKI